MLHLYYIFEEFSQYMGFDILEGVHKRLNIIRVLQVNYHIFVSIAKSS